MDWRVVFQSFVYFCFWLYPHQTFLISVSCSIQLKFLLIFIRTLNVTNGVANILSLLFALAVSKVFLSMFSLLDFFIITLETGFRRGESRRENGSAWRGEEREGEGRTRRRKRRNQKEKRSSLCLRERGGWLTRERLKMWGQDGAGEGGWEGIGSDMLWKEVPEHSSQNCWDHIRQLTSHQLFPQVLEQWQKAIEEIQWAVTSLSVRRRDMSTKTPARRGLFVLWVQPQPSPFSSWGLYQICLHGSHSYPKKVTHKVFPRSIVESQIWRKH